MKHVQDSETGAETIIAYKGEECETAYYKIDGDVYANEFYSFLIKTSRPVTDDEMGQVCSILGYRFRSTVGGEGLEWPERIADDTFVIVTDSTKGNMNNFGDFHDTINDYIASGTPVRKRCGTRAIGGVKDLTIDFYSDSALKFI